MTTTADNANATDAVNSKRSKTFTLADLAREMKIDPKLARRRMRANTACEKPMPTPKFVDITSKAQKYVYSDTKGNRDKIAAIIADPAAD